MKSFLRFVVTTLLGGVFFLAPLILAIAVVGKALEIANRIVAPLAVRMPVESVGGIRAAKLLAVAGIVLFCVLAGFFARVAFARRVVDRVESVLVSNVPGYELIKSVGGSALGIDTTMAYQLVLARIEEAWQLAFLIECIEGGHVAVFVPAAPRPWSGSVYFMTEDRIRRLGISYAEARKCLGRLGAGSNELLRDALRDPGSG